jgi:diguanylate cyclase (GGDEF)-like protein/PAS domain S-box-containing protein
MDPSRFPIHDVLPEDDPERLRLLADGAREPILIHDRGFIVDVNRAFCELLERSREQLIGVDVRQWLRSEDRDRLVGLAGGGQTLTQRFGVIRPGGGQIDLEGTGSPVTYRGRQCRIVRLVDIGRELEAERAADEWERVMREVLQTMPLLTVMQDLEGRILFCNDLLATTAGYTCEELTGRIWAEVLSVGDVDENREQARRRISGETWPHEELILRTRDGSHRLIAWSTTPMRDRRGVVFGHTAIGEDITDRRNAEAATATRARRNAAVARLGVAGLRLGVEALQAEAMPVVQEALEVDLVSMLRPTPGDDGSLLAVAVAGWPAHLAGTYRVSAATGSLAHRVLISELPVIFDDTSRVPAGPAARAEGVRSAMGVPIHGCGTVHGVLMVHHRTPRVFTEEEAHVLQAVANVLAAAFERDQAEQRVAHLAFHDPLTGLPNRAALHDRLDHLLALADKHGRAAAVLWVDIDHFQLVNDSFGQNAGDAVIRQVADRLRRAAGGADMLTRHAGDEFLLVVADASDDPSSSDCRSVDDVAQIAQAIAGRVQAAFAEPFDAGGAEVFLRPCLGIAIHPVHASDRDGLLRHADVAKGQAKSALRAGTSVSRNVLDPMHEVSLTARLHRALAEERFILHYQPVVEIATGRVRSVEALVRWQDAEHGLVPPGDFIPLAERTGLIGPLTDWVVDEACRQLGEWHDAGLDIGVAVNVPAILWHPAAAERLIETVHRRSVDPSRVTVEVTESTVMIDPSVCDAVLARLSQAGLRLAIDDFGTGHSSLARLRQLPVTTLKIDRSFVRELGGDPAAEALVDTVIGLARNLGLEPLAEGIETEQQRVILLARGCRVGQGFLFSRPVPAARISDRCAIRRAA